MAAEARVVEEIEADFAVVVAGVALDQVSFRIVEMPELISDDRWTVLCRI